MGRHRSPVGETVMIQMLNTARTMRTMYEVEARSEATARRLAATLARLVTS